MNFGQALEAAKSGSRITREGWNGKGLWLEYHNPMPTMDLPYLRLSYPVGGAAYPDGARVPWAPSQTDVLADDWGIHQ